MDTSGTNYDMENIILPDERPKLTKKEREEEWRQGVHTTSEGVEWKIRDMTSLHIDNTIAHFRYRFHYDTSPLEAEKERRKLLKKKRRNLKK